MSWCWIANSLIKFAGGTTHEYTTKGQIDWAKSKPNEMNFIFKNSNVHKILLDVIFLDVLTKMKISHHRTGAINKWHHPLRGEGGSAKRWHYSMSISLFINMGEKAEGGVKNLKKWVTSMMDAHIVFILSLVLQVIFWCIIHNHFSRCLCGLKKYIYILIVFILSLCTAGNFLVHNTFKPHFKVSLWFED